MLLKIKLNFCNKFSKIQFLALNRTSTGQITKFGVLIHVINPKARMTVMPFMNIAVLTKVDITGYDHYCCRRIWNWLKI